MVITFAPYIVYESGLAYRCESLPDAPWIRFAQKPADEQIAYETRPWETSCEEAFCSAFRGVQGELTGKPRCTIQFSLGESAYGLMTSACVGKEGTSNRSILVALSIPGQGTPIAFDTYYTHCVYNGGMPGDYERSAKRWARLETNELFTSFVGSAKTEVHTACTPGGTTFAVTFREVRYAELYDGYFMHETVSLIANPSESRYYFVYEYSVDVSS